MTEQVLFESFIERPMTLDEWAELPEDEPGEVTDDVLVEEEVPDWLHEEIVVWLAAVLRAWAKSTGARVGGSEAKFAVSGSRGRKADLSMYFAGRRPPARGLIHTPPDVAVEVVSSRPSDGRRDRVEKVLEYARFGIRYYWLVDPQLRSFEVLALSEDGRYVHALAATSGRLTEIPGCPDLVIDLDELWQLTDDVLGPENPT
jgi:Uma2 family endonuclease